VSAPSTAFDRIAAAVVPRDTAAALALSFAERFLAVLMLAALAPLLVALGAAISILSRNGPLIAHRRIGRYGQSFWVLKFRTMWPAAGIGPARARWIERIVDEEGPRRKARCDPRVTHWLARLCRRFSLDETPQLLHVIAGHMSLVGPRPLTQTELRVYYGAKAAEVLDRKPGLTGLWQVMGRNRLTYRQRRRLDLFYVRKASALLYLMVLARTVPLVVFGKDSW